MIIFETVLWDKTRDKTVLWDKNRKYTNVDSAIFVCLEFSLSTSEVVVQILLVHRKVIESLHD